MKPRLTYTRSHSGKLIWTCATKVCQAYGNTPQQAYHRWLMAKGGH